jgi:phenylalanyl-tRNA synthetase beta subunit
MQDTARTLEDAEIEAAVAKLVAVAARDFAASLR